MKVLRALGGGLFVAVIVSLSDTSPIHVAAAGIGGALFCFSFESSLP